MKMMGRRSSIVLLFLLHPYVDAFQSLKWTGRRKIDNRRPCADSQGPSTLSTTLDNECSLRQDSIYYGQSPIHRGHLRKLLALVAGVSTIRTTQALAAVSSAPTKLPPVLGWRNLVSAASLVLASGGVMLSLSGMQTLAIAIVKACFRSTLQLYLIGGYLLTRFLVAANTQPWMVGAWVLFTGMMAGREAASRTEYTYKSMRRHLVLSILTGGVSVMGASLLLEVLGSIEPWYDPRTWIPVAGMIFGNSLTATSLAISTITKEMVTNKSQIELRLSQGATVREALAPVQRTVYSTAFNPVINFLSVAGIVHIPGMMTGQLLAGQAPFQAAAYQLAVFFMIASTATTAVQMLVRLSEAHLVDRVSDRLLNNRLKPKIPCKEKRKGPLSTAGSIWRSVRGFLQRESDGCKDVETPQTELAQVLELDNGSNSSTAKVSVLSVDNVFSSRANAYMSLQLNYDDRVAIVGPSGVGKSQLLRTVTGLEPVDRSKMHLFEELDASQISMAEWRSHVMLVPQEHPPLEGTPNDFFRQTISYSSQVALLQAEKVNALSGLRRSHIEYGQQWGVKAELFDQPWSTLSGGESQRIRLAIALSLQPDVLLLDESTSAVDEATTLKVEATLKALRTPIIMVSHSQEQVERFCNRRLHLTRPTVNSVSQQ